MLKISIIDKNNERRLVVEGKLIQPWIEEFNHSFHRAADGLQGRERVIDLSNATVISREGEEAIFELMRQGAKFSCGGVLTKYVVKQLARRCHAWVSSVDPKESMEIESSTTEVHIDACKR